MKFDQHPDFFTDDEQEDPAVESAVNDNAAPTDTDTETTTATDNNDEEELQSSHTWRKIITWVAIVVVIGLATAFYFRYVSPYATDIKAAGLVYNVEKRGWIFKTYECCIATTDALADSISPYSRTDFSIADPNVAVQLQEAQLNGDPVTITYSRYFGTLPWRGASLNIITAVAPR